MALSSRLLTLRKSPILLKLPPYLSALCVAVGIAWLLLLPLNEYSRRTYVSENAILPGQVHTYFGGSEHTIFRAYRQEVFALASRDAAERYEGLQGILRDNGLKAATQPYAWRVASETKAGTNVYGLLQGPRADATEAMVLMAAWRNFDGEINYSGVALALTLARYFKRWSIWSKDIIVLIPDDSVYGPQAWVSAYHSTEATVSSRRNISALPIKAGALQAAVALDYPAGPWGHRFEKLDVLYDGLNGALPNLDLLNTAVDIASNQMGISCSLHNMVSHSDSYTDRLQALAKGIVTQSVGVATGPHSAFIPYHVDAITLKTVGDGWHDEMSLGRTTESVFRSINNLLEHLHQSFFFYILLNTNRFVSIGNYLPAAMIIAGSFTITALALWVKSGKAVDETDVPITAGRRVKHSEVEAVQSGEDVVLLPKAALQQIERKMSDPAFVMMVIHALGLLPLWTLGSPRHSNVSTVFYSMVALSWSTPLQFAPSLAKSARQQIELLQCFSLLFLGAFLSTLASLNFSLAFLLGIICAPLSFARPLPAIPARSSIKTRDDAQQFVRVLAIHLPVTALFLFISPPSVLYLIHCFFRGFKSEIGVTMFQMAEGLAQGVWTSVVVWMVWWPAWVIGGIVLYSGSFRPIQA